MSSSSSIRSSRQHGLRAVTLREDCLVWVVQGEKRLHTPQGVLTFKAGEVLAMPRGCRVDIENLPPTGGLYLARMLTFSDASVSRFMQGDGGVPTHKRIAGVEKVAGGTVLQASFLHACQALDDPAQHSEKIQEHRVQEVLLALSGVGMVFAPSAQLSWSERVRRLVAQRPADPWDCDTVARAFALSPASLQRRLADENISLAACVRETRMETAMSLLQSTQKPIYDIAQTCGYRSVSRFSMAFRQRYGALPSHLR